MTGIEKYLREKKKPAAAFINTDSVANRHATVARFLEGFPSLLLHALLPTRQRE